MHVEENLQIKYTYGSYINKCLVRNSNDVWFQKCLNWIVFSRGTTINLFQNKTIEEDEKCQHRFKHTVARNRFLCLFLKCVINSTIYLRGIYRKIFFNLAEFHFWPLMLMLQRRTDARLRRRTIVKCQTSHRCHGGQRTSASEQDFQDHRQCTILVGYDCHNGRPSKNFASTKPDQCFFGRTKVWGA